LFGRLPEVCGKLSLQFKQLTCHLLRLYAAGNNWMKLACSTNGMMLAAVNGSTQTKTSGSVRSSQQKSHGMTLDRTHNYVVI
jgi:hypothetical protein